MENKISREEVKKEDYFEPQSMNSETTLTAIEPGRPLVQLKIKTTYYLGGGFLNGLKPGTGIYALRHTFKPQKSSQKCS